MYCCWLFQNDFKVYALWIKLLRCCFLNTFCVMKYWFFVTLEYLFSMLKYFNRCFCDQSSLESAVPDGSRLTFSSWIVVMKHMFRYVYLDVAFVFCCINLWSWSIGSFAWLQFPVFFSYFLWLLSVYQIVSCI